MRIVVYNYTLNLYNDAEPFAHIVLYGSEENKNNHYIVRLEFSHLKDSKADLEQNNNFVRTSMPIELYSNVVDLLRNEKPVYYNWFTETRTGVLSTGEEPVGEGEHEDE